MPQRRRVLVSRLAGSRLVVSSVRAAWSPVVGSEPVAREVWVELSVSGGCK